jgi:hypothetical protein
MPLAKYSFTFQQSYDQGVPTTAKYPIKTIILPYKYDFIRLPTSSLLLF